MLQSPSKLFRFLLIALVVLALVLRLYKLTTPLLDWHSFRQADTASVTREYVKHGIDLLHPTYQDLSNVASGFTLPLVNGKTQDNVNGWRMVEFPIINGAIALVIRAFPMLDLVVVSRLASITASLGTLIYLTLFTKHLFGRKVAILAGFFFATLPYAVFYSRTILPEPYLLLGVTVTLYYFSTYLRKPSNTALIATVVAFAFALLMKPMAAFYIPGFVILGVVQYGKRVFWQWKLFLGAVLSILPLLAWREWIQQYPHGIPYNTWLYNSDMIRLRPAWFYWLFGRRIGELITGVFGSVLLMFGIIPTAPKKGTAFIWGAGVGMLAYLIVFATGNVRHDYYQNLLLPFLVILLARGTAWFLHEVRFIVPTIRVAVLCLILFGMYSVSWNAVKGYYNINRPDFVEVGKAVDRLIPPDAKVIAPMNGDTAFLFQLNRRGWPVQFDIDLKISEGATYYVSVNFDDEANELMKKYTVVAKTDEYVIIDLQHKKTNESL